MVNVVVVPLLRTPVCAACRQPGYADVVPRREAGGAGLLRRGPRLGEDAPRVARVDAQRLPHPGPRLASVAQPSHAGAGGARFGRRPSRLPAARALSSPRVVRSRSEYESPGKQKTHRIETRAACDEAP